MAVWLKGATIINQEKACNWYVELVITMLSVNEQCLIYTRNKQNNIILKTQIVLFENMKTCVIKISIDLYENINMWKFLQTNFVENQLVPNNIYDE